MTMYKTAKRLCFAMCVSCLCSLYSLESGGHPYWLSLVWDQFLLCCSSSLVVVSAAADFVANVVEV